MRLAEAMERVHAFEDRFDPASFRVEGWSIWPMFRLPVVMALATPDCAAPKACSLRQRIMLALRDLPLIAPRRWRAVVRTYCSGLVEQDEEGWRDAWMDDLVQALEPSCVLMAANAPAHAERLGQARRRPQATGTGIEALAVLLARASPGDGEVARAFSSLLAKLDGTLPERLGVAHQVALHRWRLRLWRTVLGRQPSDLLVVADPGEFALVAAAKERGMTVLEVQHGMIYANHPCYAWRTRDQRHRAHLPIPTYLLLHGEHARQELLPLGFYRPGELLVLGSGRLDRKRQRAPGSKLWDLVITTGGTSVDELCAFVSRALADPRLHGMRVAVRLHPIYDPDPGIYRRLLGKDTRVDVRLASQDDVLDLMLSARAHASIASTCHFDAIALGIPTAIIPLPTHEELAFLARRGHATLLADAAGLVDFLLAPPPVPAAVSDHYYARDSRHRALRIAERFATPMQDPEPLIPTRQAQDQAC